MIERRTWAVTAWQGVLAGIWVIVAALSAYVALSTRDAGTYIDTTRLAAIANEVALEDQRYRSSSKSLAAIAPALINKIDFEHRHEADIVDDGGKFVTGNKEVLDYVPVPIPPKGAK